MAGVLSATIILLFVLCGPPSGSALTLDEAVDRALGVSYPVKEQDEIVKRYRFSYISTIDPYLPRLDTTTAYTRYLNRSVNAPVVGSTAFLTTGRDIFSFVGTLSYRLFDGGQRYAQRKGAFSTLERETERLKGVKTEIVYVVKSGFYGALSKRDVVERRKESLAATERIYDLTKARYIEGVTKKSDVLQTEVRVSTVRIELANAVTEYEKALEDLKSLLLYQALDVIYLRGDLVEPSVRFDGRQLVEKALQMRPDVTAQIKEIDRLNMAYKDKQALWWPKLDAQLVQARTDKTFFAENRDDTFVLNLTYPLFDGVGRYYNMQAAKSDVDAAKFRLGETKRNVELEIVKALKDFEQARQDVHGYRELLREATSNFDQAYGEYKFGKGDILTLLQAERDLAKAKENVVVSLFGANNALANLERKAYLSEK
jgi:outer membrane protein TolC